MKSNYPAPPRTIVRAIYSITHRDTGRRYVGSAVNVATRWAVHRSILRRGKHHCKPLQRAWAKYGKDAFDFEIVEVVKVLADLLAREQFHLDALWRMPVERRYNTCPEASSTRGRPVSAVTREKIRQKLVGRPLPPDHGSRAYHGDGGRLPAEVRELVRDLRRSGKTYPEIETATAVSRFTARRLCRGIRLTPVQRRRIWFRRLASDDEVAAAKHLRSEWGWSHKMIARIFGVHRYTVSRWLSAEVTT